MAFFLNYLATAVVQNQTGNAVDVRALELLWKQHAVDAAVTVTRVLSAYCVCFLVDKVTLKEQKKNARMYCLC